MQSSQQSLPSGQPVSLAARFRGHFLFQNGASVFGADFPMDMWSIACTTYELFTADILFKGTDNNDMLRLIMDLKGPFPKKMLKKGAFVHLHFAGPPLSEP
jgi:serine/threonine protein kinase